MRTCFPIMPMQAMAGEELSAMACSAAIFPYLFYATEHTRIVDRQQIDYTKIPTLSNPSFLSITLQHR